MPKSKASNRRRPYSEDTVPTSQGAELAQSSSKKKNDQILKPSANHEALLGKSRSDKVSERKAHEDLAADNKAAPSFSMSPEEESPQQSDQSPAADMTSSFKSDSASTYANEEPKTEPVEVDFFGSAWLRANAPKAMEAVEMVVDDWSKDGHFEGLPVGSPLAQYIVSRALQRAKKVEKKLEEKGIISMVKMSAAVLKAQINEKLGQKN